MFGSEGDFGGWWTNWVLGKKLFGGRGTSGKGLQNHFFIQSNIVHVDLKDIPRCDLVFYDAHAYGEQYEFHKKASELKVIDDLTTIVCHDTGLHSQKFVGWSVSHGNHWMHQSAERILVKKLCEDGYQAIHVHDDDSSEPRHGLTILQIPKQLT